MAQDQTTSQSETPARCCNRPGNIICRGLVPAWLLTGAIAKLIDLTPKLLPKPVKDIYSWIASQIGMGADVDIPRFFDVALRTTIAIEMSLVATMLLLPKFSRAVAGAILSLFVLILARVVLSGDASCGCFGSKGPPPVVVLIVDASLLAGVLIFKPRPCGIKKAFVGAWIAAVAFAFALAFGMPDKTVASPAGSQNSAAPQQPKPAVPAPTPGHADSVTPPTDTTKPAPQPGATTTTPQGSSPGVKSGATAWPTPPAKLQPYYMPQVEQWVGQPLRSQPLAALIQNPPADLEQGRWIVMFFREDCDHCHAVLERYFMEKLPAPTLLVAVPDTDPAAALPNPCVECKQTSFVKGPEYVVGTPILLAIENGVIKSVCVDAENTPSLEATLAFRRANDAPPKKK